MRPPARPRRVAPVPPDRAASRPAPARPAEPTGPAAPRSSSGAASGAVPPGPAGPPQRAAEVAGDGRPGSTSGASRAASDTPSQAVAARGKGWQPVRPAVVSTGSAARFAERSAMRRRLTWRRIGLSAAGVLVVGALAWLLLLSPVLALDLDEVELLGQGTVVDAAAVAAVVQPHDGTPLPRLDTVALRRSLLDVPGVRAAEVARVWPHGLRITVVSREPVAAVPQGRDEGYALLDVEGVQVGRSDTPPVGLPVVSVPLDDEGARSLTAVLTVLQQLPPELVAEIATMSATSQDTVTFVLHSGATVEWGSADQTALKVRVLATLRAAPASQWASVFDVSAPTLPITRS